MLTTGLKSVEYLTFSILFSSRASSPSLFMKETSFATFSFLRSAASTPSRLGKDSLLSPGATVYK